VLKVNGDTIDQIPFGRLNDCSLRMEVLLARAELRVTWERQLTTAVCRDGQFIDEPIEPSDAPPMQRRLSIGEAHCNIMHDEIDKGRPQSGLQLTCMATERLQHEGYTGPLVQPIEVRGQYVRTGASAVKTALKSESGKRFDDFCRYLESSASEALYEAKAGRDECGLQFYEITLVYRRAGLSHVEFLMVAASVHVRLAKELHRYRPPNSRSRVERSCYSSNHFQLLSAWQEWLIVRSLGRLYYNALRWAAMNRVRHANAERIITVTLKVAR